MRVRVYQISDTEIMFEMENVSICIVNGKINKCKNTDKKCKIGLKTVIYHQYGDKHIVLSQEDMVQLLDIILRVLGKIFGNKYYIHRSKLFTILSTLLKIRYVAHDLIEKLIKQCNNIIVTYICDTHTKGRKDRKYLIEVVHDIELPYEAVLTGKLIEKSVNKEYIDMRNTFLRKIVKDDSYVYRLLSMLPRSVKGLAIYVIYDNPIITVPSVNVLRRVKPFFRAVLFKGETYAIVYDGDNIIKMIGRSFEIITNYKSFLNYLFQIFPLLRKYTSNVTVIKGEWYEICLKKILEFLDR